MILSTHAIVGAALARFMPNPGLAFLVGIASHFLLDAIPHRDYKLLSVERGDKPLDRNISLFSRRFILDLLRVGIDFAVGAFFVWLLFWSGIFADRGDGWIIFAGFLGGPLPDFFQILYMKFKITPFVQIQRFHTWIHFGRDLNKPVPIALFLQGVVALFFVVISFWLA